MASNLKCLLVVALLICVAVVNPSPLVLKRALDRYCTFTHEQKRVVATCMMNGYPNVLRDFILACTPPEDINGSWETFIEMINHNCDPEQYETRRRRIFLACLDQKQEEANYRVSEEDMNEVINMAINCINQDITES